MAQRFNHAFGKDILKLPEARVRKDVATLPASMAGKCQSIQQHYRTTYHRRSFVSNV